MSKRSLKTESDSDVQKQGKKPLFIEQLTALLREDVLLCEAGKPSAIKDRAYQLGVEAGKLYPNECKYGDNIEFFNDVPEYAPVSLYRYALKSEQADKLIDDAVAEAKSVGDISMIVTLHSVVTVLKNKFYHGVCDGALSTKTESGTVH